MVNLALHGCIKVSILVEEVLCEVIKHLNSKAEKLNLEQVKSFMATVGREYDLVTTHLLMSLARYCVTMTQLTHTLILQHREHTEEQGWSVRWRLVWDTAPAFSTVHLSLLWTFDYNREEQNGCGQFIFSLLMRRGRAAECMLFYFFCLQWACCLWLWVSQWRTVTEHQSVSVADEMGSCGVLRKGFQRAYLWEKFKASSKIYWDEGK